MKKALVIFLCLLLVLLVSILFKFCNYNRATNSPFTVKDNLFNQEKIGSLGLKYPKGIETVTVFKPTDSTDYFNNGAILTRFKDYFYCQWQSSVKDEDSKDTWVAYSRSRDGKQWTKPKVLAKTLDSGYCTSGGWWKYGDTLVAFINEWPDTISPKGGFTYYKTSFNGINWSQKKPVTMADGSVLKGVIEQDIHNLPSGRLICAAHFQPGLKVLPIYTDDPKGIRGWKRANFYNLSTKDDVSREIEPSCFIKDDDNVVMIFRDQESSHRILASYSKDCGENWSKTIITGMPDSRSKQSAGNLPNGTVFLVNNPVENKKRTPLVITLSQKGNRFNKAYLLRNEGNIQPLRYEGRYKKAGYHYPKSFIEENYLYVSYTTNKEDVEYTKVPLSSLILE